VSTHLDHVETAFSFRTRVLDYLWAGLPIVCTAGDAMGDLVDAHGLGAAVPADDVSALAHAIDELLSDDAARANAAAAVRKVAPEFAWSRGLRPLVAFCDAPRRAADLLDRETSGRLAAVGKSAARQRRGPVHVLASLRRHVRNGRGREVLQMALRRLRS
jgi:hypothetical protein